MTYKNTNFITKGRKVAASSFLILLSWNSVHAATPVATPINKKAPFASSTPAEASSTVTITSFALKGNVAIAESELQGILLSYINQRCDLKKLREAADKVTAEYARRGHPFAKGYIMPQNIANGIVTITVVEGRIGKIIITGNKNYSSRFINKYLTSGGNTALTVDRIERGLLLLNSTFTDLKVTANFVPGVEPGTTDIIVKVEDSFPLHLNLSANNFGSEFVSRYRYGAQAEWTNPLISGSLLTLGGFTGNKIKTMHIVNGGYSFPLNSVGTIVGINALSGYFEVGKEFAELGIHNNEVSGDVFIKHPVVVNRKSSLSLKLGVRASDAKYYLLDAISSEDKVRAVYLGLQGDMMALGGKSFAGFTVTKGLGNFMKGTRPGDLLASRSNANNDFTRFNLDVAHLLPVSNIFSTLIRLSGQYSDNNLLAGEEWLIGGVNSVHGFTSGEASGNKGYSGSFSLRMNPLENKEHLQLSAFIDHGYATKKFGLIGAHLESELTGVGIGLYSHFGTVTPIDVRLDVGWPLNPKSNFLGENPLFSFETSIRF